MTRATAKPTIDNRNERALRERAAKVIPAGMYGHMRAHTPHMPQSYPQFWSRGEGVYAWDVDDNRFIDFMCSFGPMLLGHRNPVVEAAAQQQAQLGDALSGPSPRMVELAELFTETVAHADWAMFAKNGTDATSAAVRIARVASGRRKLLKATKAYHGANEWFTPITAGVTAEDRANIVEFAYNDITDLQRVAAEHAGDIAAIIVTPFRHDSYAPQEHAEAQFARTARELATREGAALILDEVRAGFRLHVKGSWEPLAVRPDMTAFSKAIANGYALSALVGADSLREAASQVYVTGSFWFSAVAMAAGIATVTQAVELDAPAVMAASGERFRLALEAQAAGAGLPLAVTGPPQMPLLNFVDDSDLRKALAFTDAAARRGVLLHPWHNMFLSTAHTTEVIDDVLDRTQDAFAEIAQKEL